MRSQSLEVKNETQQDMLLEENNNRGGGVLRSHTRQNYCSLFGSNSAAGIFVLCKKQCAVFLRDYPVHTVGKEHNTKDRAE